MENAGDIPDKEMKGWRAMFHWASGYPAALTLSQPAPLLSGAIDYELWRLSIATAHRHMATRWESLSLGQGFGVQRAIAAGAGVLPAAVLATLPQDVAVYVTGCTNLTRQAGLAASLGADFVCADTRNLKTLSPKL